MKNKTVPTETSISSLNEDDIRDYAYHLYVQSGCAPDRDMENWLEARACLEANIPQSESHTRLHRHAQRKRQPKDVVCAA